MANTIYASFNDASLAERAAGALLDHGVQSEDLSLVRQGENMNGDDIQHSSASTANYQNQTTSEVRQDDMNGGDYAGMPNTDDASSGISGTQYTSGTMIGGPGSVNAMGSGIQPTAHHGSMSSPESNNFGETPTAGYADVEENAAERGQGFIGDANDTNEDTLRSMRESPSMGSTDAGLTTSGSIGASRGMDDEDTAGRMGSGAMATGGYDTTGMSGENGMDSTTRSEYRDDNENDDDDRADHHSGDPESAAKKGISTTTAADAGSGAIKGTAIGAGVGILAGIVSLMVPGIGLVVGGGALAAALGGVAASAGAGAAAGGVFGYLKDQGMEDHVAQQYSDTVKRGGALLAVQAPSGNVSEDEIRQILTKYGASNVGANASQSGYMA